MILVHQQQPLIPQDSPRVIQPVGVTLTCPVYYQAGTVKEPKLKRVTSPMFCSAIFAETVLAAIEREMVEAEKALVHLGIYAARPARMRDGIEIHPKRWSNHAHGLAIDWCGIANVDGTVYQDQADLAGHNDLLPARLIGSIAEAIKSAGRRPEIVAEGTWTHIGIWPG